jgi:hypothetical protein
MRELKAETRELRMKHLTMSELEAGFEDITRSPKDSGVVEMIVRRPQVGEREVIEEAQLDLTEGLVGDSWRRRTSRPTARRIPRCSSIS